MSERFAQIQLMWSIWGIVRPDWELRHYMDAAGPAPSRRQENSEFNVGIMEHWRVSMQFETNVPMWKLKKEGIL